MRKTTLILTGLIFAAATLAVAGPAEAVVRARRASRGLRRPRRRCSRYARGSGDDLPDHQPRPRLQAPLVKNIPRRLSFLKMEAASRKSPQA
jgi:hypothetical protein